MANFEVFHGLVAELEGGYQNRKDDPGNKNSLGVFVGTKYGISAPVYEKWIGYPPTSYDMEYLSKETAREIFKTLYWDKMNASKINSQAIAETLVDHGINAGTGTSGRIMQRVLNASFGKSLLVDGIVGNNTIAAINSVNETELFKAFSNARISDYETKANKDFWLNIWKNRVYKIADKFGIDVKKKQ